MCVIGGGMAGLSVAAGLAAVRRVLLIEREPHWAYHSTGRSAALFAESYGNDAVRALTRASRGFYLGEAGPANEDAPPFTRARGALYIAGSAQGEALNALHAELSAVSQSVSPLDPGAVLQRCPMLRSDGLLGGLFDPDARDIDVAVVVDHFARRFRSLRGEQCRDAPVTGLDHSNGEWHIRAGDHRFRAQTIVNAAGAWADEVARTAGLPVLGLEPRRRTAVRVSAAPWSVTDWPFVADVDEQWYFRPDAGALMLSPADETPSVPCDAQPDDYDVALTIERVEAATQLTVDRPLSAWAGLRTFVADRTPVVGFDPEARGFYWLAGQGGYGIQLAPALAEFVVAEITGSSLPASLAAEGVDPKLLSPARIARH